ncbi:MAG: HDOD domain-containing protein [Fimbriimonadales bacterium]|nr:HDOD domain-containing protein [Fimbriimonadales bacterium]
MESAVKTLQPLPQVVMQLVELVDSDAATVEQIESLINAEPVLCGKVLQIANSAYYGLSRSVGSIRAALLLLGAHAVKGIALSVASVAALQGGRAVGKAERMLWHHSVAVASYAQGIARACRWGLRASEDAYIAGLLHDIGTLFLLTKFPKLYQPLVLSESEQLLITRERELFGYDHADIGAMIVEHWKLPTRIVRAVGQHHAPYLPEGESQQLAAAVALADRWDAERRGGVHEAGDFPDPERVAQLVPIGEQEAARLRQDVGGSLDTLCELLLGQ